MGLKINQTTDLDDLFSKFAIEPNKKSKEEEKSDPKKEDKDKKKGK
ncbi:SPJ_0845 family protein [Ligilactobacillus apodemi]|nr:SPJ_0845 family protein [Ligilactobacillus apodemi]MBD5069858.1 hypothetical protein [Lactobacillus sp.]MCR1900534.1 SPJ_0845 family protein [Ligilactobacillus apodemi]